MCRKSTMKTISEGNETGPSSGGVVNGVNKRNETPEEKALRRKVERKLRTKGKREAKGLHIQSIANKVVKQFSEVWVRETTFVNQMIQCLPEVRQPGILLDEEERAEEYIIQGKNRGGDEGKEKALAQKFHAKVRSNLKEQGVEATSQRATSYQELKERLHRRMAELAQRPNQEKRDKKLKKKQKKLIEAKSNKGKKLISQSIFSTNAADKSSTDPVEKEEKTPLKKKPVVKSNGDIVYSKFDFISSEARTNGTFEVGAGKKGKKGNVKPTAEELLKKVEKHEKTISSLATQGKKSEAVDLAETQKWDTALKRADGEKVRDDRHLLKKTIKKMDKQKQVTKKKWKARVERVEKQKEIKQQKRQTNIQARRDDKKKRMKKLLRKKGRIA